MMYLFLRDAVRAGQIVREAIAVSREYQLPQWLGFGHGVKGWAAFHQGDRDEGIRLQEEGLRHILATGARTHASRMYANLAESYLLVGDTVTARAHLSAAHAHCERHGEHYYAAALCRLQAQLLALEGAAPEEVEGWLARALDIARAQQAGLLELRAATTLAGLRSARGERAAAREALAPVAARFSGESAWLDVRDAMARLREL
jgi:tetratricopeptide (TPR) repeat protein